MMACMNHCSPEGCAPRLIEVQVMSVGTWLSRFGNARRVWHTAVNELRQIQSGSVCTCFCGEAWRMIGEILCNPVPRDLGFVPPSGAYEGHCALNNFAERWPGEPQLAVSSVVCAILRYNMMQVLTALEMCSRRLQAPPW
jgi:hypothetical protein